MNRPGRCRCFLGCALLVAAVSAASPQAAAQDFFEIVDVPLVEVDVLVTDGQGRPVDDLSRESFTLLVDGEEQAFSFFASHRIPEPDGTVVAGSLSAHLVILFDNNGVERQNRNVVIEDFRGFLAEAPDPLQKIMVATLSRAGLEVHQEFTSDLALTDAALERVAETVAHDVRASGYEALLRDIQKLAGARDPTLRDSVSQTATLVSRILGFSERARQDAARVASNIWELTQALDGLQGRRTILYVGGAVSVSPGESLLTALKGILDRSGDGWATKASANLPAGVGSGGSREIDSLSLAASLHGVSIFSVVVGGGAQVLSTGTSASSLTSKDSSTMDSSGSWSPGFDSRVRNESRSGLDKLAEATGGYVHTMIGRVGPTLERIRNQMASRYVLGFQPTGGSDGQLHRISIEVAGRRLRVRHRRVFRVRGWDEEFVARLRSSHHFGVAENPLAVDLEAHPAVTSPAGGMRIPLTLRVPLSSIALEPVERSHRGQLSVFMISGDVRFQTAPARKTVLPVVLPNDELLGVMGRVGEYRLDLGVPEGTTQIAVGVRDDLDTEFSNLSLELPVEQTGRVSAGRVAGTESVRRASDVATLRLPTAALIMSGQNGGLIGLTLEATLEPASGDLWNVPVEIRLESAAGDAPSSLDLFLYALAADGTVVAKDSRIVVREHGSKTVVPIDLPRGRYVIRAAARDRESSAFGVTGMEIEIPGPSAEPPRWSSAAPATDLRPEDSVSQSEKYAAGDLRLSREGVVSGYQQVLEALAAGDEAAARDALRTTEMGMAGERTPRDLADLAKMEGRVLKRLANGDWNRLLPLAVLYGEMIDDYRRRRLAPLSEHAIVLSTGLAEQMARKASSPEGKREAADLLTSLSGVLLYLQRLGQTVELLDLATKEDPHNVSALMALAATREQRGDYEGALKALKTIVEVAPDSGEGRLRLGVNLARIGNSLEAGESFRQLMGAEVEEWVEQVATQELARALVDVGNTAEAVEVLESAAIRWPEQPSMRVQLAWLLDQIEEPARAGEWVSGLISDSSGATDPPRYRYIQWYEDGLDEVRQRLMDHSVRRAGELSRRLSLPEGGIDGR